MHNPQLVDVLNPTDDLLEHFAGFVFFHPLLLNDVVEELSAFHELHNQKQMFGGFDDFVELDDVGVADELEDVDFTGDSFDVGHIDDLLLFEDLDGDFLTRDDVDAHLDLAKRPLAQGLV